MLLVLFVSVCLLCDGIYLLNHNILFKWVILASRCQNYIFPCVCVRVLLVLLETMVVEAFFSNRDSSCRRQ